MRGNFIALCRIDKYLSWIIFGIILKLLFGVYLHYNVFLFDNGREPSNYFFLISGDHYEFFNPTNNLVEKGSYSLFEGSGPYAGRLPGYIFPYILFRILFTEKISLLLLGLFQIFSSAVTAYLLARLAGESANNNIRFFLFVFLVSLFLPYFWQWDFYYHPASLSVMLYVLLLYIIKKKFIPDGRYAYVLFAGFCMAWIFFLRPFLGIYFISVLILIVIVSLVKKAKMKNIAFRIFLFLLPLVIIESAWAVRNYFAFKQFIPLQTSLVPFAQSGSDYSYGSTSKYSVTVIRKLVSAWGGDCAWYFQGSEMGWFFENDKIKSNKFEFKNYVFCNGFTKDSISLLKENLQLSFNNNFSRERKDSLEEAIISRSERFRRTYISENKIHYYFFSPLLRIKNFLIKNVTQDWRAPLFGKPPLLYMALKIASLFLYYFFLISGLLVIITLPWLWKIYSAFEWMIIANILLLVGTFGFLIDLSHYHYFATGYIGLFVLTANNIQRFRRRIQQLPQHSFLQRIFGEAHFL
ncbi:MAG: hypothetical protein HY841_01575 [Bacteroidetes bacterium]|nr:hypothetical protein [Bacteroidota bacterium]